MGQQSGMNSRSLDRLPDEQELLVRLTVRRPLLFPGKIIVARQLTENAREETLQQFLKVAKQPQRVVQSTSQDL